MGNDTVSFEENYIFRNNKSITSNNDIAPAMSKTPKE